MMNAFQSGTKESKTNRSVSFSQTDETYNVLAIDDYTAEEFARTWYNLDELVVIAHENLMLVRKIENDDIDILGRYYCIRGLEGMTGARKDRVNDNRCKAYDAVLHEQQEAQSEDGRDDQELIGQERDDQELIAQIYRAVSAHCSIEAAKVGLSDEQAVHIDYWEAETK
jgi:hypothetical protein